MGTAAPPPRSPSKAPTASSTASTAQSTRTSTPVLSGSALSSLPSSSAAVSVSLEPSSSQVSIASTIPEATPRLSASPAPPPPPAAAATAATATHSSIPRVIPLHGHLSTLSCSACKHEVALSGPYVDLLATGSAPICPACLSIDEARSAAGERSRGVGMMRPDVVLYGEEHKDGDRVGEITQRDLMGQRPDLLIVVGTTLKVKGTKRLVRELAKVIKPVASSTPTTTAAESDSSASTSTSGTTKQTRSSLAQEAAANAAAAAAAAGASASQPPRKRRPARPAPIHTLYLNYDFPTPAREWGGVFDCWLRGDIQEFVEAVKREEVAFKKEMDDREKKRGEKRKRDAEGAPAAGGAAAAGGATKKKAPGPAAKKVSAAAAAAAGAWTSAQRPLVPAHSAHPPSPLKPPPKPAQSPRTDPNKRTRSSVHMPALAGPVPGFGVLPALPQLVQPPPVQPTAPVLPSTAFAPVAPYQHYQMPWQAPAGVFAPFTQLSQQHQVQQASPANFVPSSASTSTGSHASSVMQSHAPVWQGVPTWPPYAASDQTLSVGSVETAPTTVGSSGVPSPVKPANNGMPQQAETMTTEQWRAPLRRKESSSSLSSLSSDDEEGDDSEDDEPVHSPIAEEPMKKEETPALVAPVAPKRVRASLPTRPRPSMSTRSSASGSSNASDSNSPSVVAVDATSAQAKDDSVEPKRRSSRSSTASNTISSIEAAILRRKSGSRSPIMSIAADSIAVRAADRRRKSLTPPSSTNGKTTTTAAAAAGAVKPTKLPYPVTKRSVAKVTGTAAKGGRKRRGKSA